MGEDLKIGANLTWGPCFDYQKQFFCGTVDKVSQYPYLLRYDIEISGFGSHQSGHLVLLRLKEEMYPGGESKDHWPTLCLNSLRWAKKQGAVCGPAHSGWGLEVESDELPNYKVPPFKGIGANEYIVDVTQLVPGPDGKLVPAVDFLSMVDTPSRWELNIWYHTLNVGFRTRISGETDFPCIYGEKVGLGRSYVKLDGKLDGISLRVPTPVVSILDLIVTVGRETTKEEVNEAFKQATQSEAMKGILTVDETIRLHF